MSDIPSPPPTSAPSSAYDGVGSSFAPVPPGATQTTDGKLIASGVLSLITGGLSAIVGLWLFSVSQDSDTEWIDDLSGGAITFAALFMLAVAGLFIASGVGCVRGRRWGRITAIVVNAIVVVLTLIGIATGGDAAGAVVPLIWFGVMLGLAWAGKAKL